MLKKTDDIVGVDYDLTSLKVAESKFIGKNIKLIHADVFDYLKSIPRGSFDYIILSHVLEHIENPTEFLRKLTGMSNFIYVEVPDFDSNYLNHYRSLIMTDLIYSDADHVNEFDREELCSIINSAEFSIIKAEYRGGVMKLWCKNN
jgi:SAM-dependent methyltransferase